MISRSDGFVLCQRKRETKMHKHGRAGSHYMLLPHPSGTKMPRGWTMKSLHDFSQSCSPHTSSLTARRCRRSPGYDSELISSYSTTVP